MDSWLGCGLLLVPTSLFLTYLEEVSLHMSVCITETTPSGENARGQMKPVVVSGAC